jgi:hypothetical protein
MRIPVSTTPSSDVVVDHHDVVDFTEPLLGEHADGGGPAADAHAFFAYFIDNWRLIGLHDDGRSAIDREFGGFPVAQIEKSLAGDVAFVAAASGEMTHAAEREHL